MEGESKRKIQAQNQRLRTNPGFPITRRTQEEVATVLPAAASNSIIYHTFYIYIRMFPIV